MSKTGNKEIQELEEQKIFKQEMIDRLLREMPEAGRVIVSVVVEREGNVLYIGTADIVKIPTYH